MLTTADSLMNRPFTLSTTVFDVGTNIVDSCKFVVPIVWENSVNLILGKKKR